MTATLIRTSIDSKSDLQQIIDSMLLAFSADPLFRWVYPSDEQYLASFPGVVKLFINGRLEINCTKDLEGADFWLPPEQELDLDTFAAYMQETVSPQDLDKVAAVFEGMMQAHPQVSHRYLALLGVTTSKQGRGYGTSLIEPTLLECDRTEEIIHLETCNPRSVAFYERHGFELQKTIQIADCPVIFPMIRYPKNDVADQTLNIAIT
ncbi:MAG: GNAT family N-acetyltransferase [Cyanobacteria bacterium P01_A01_bin.84]